MPQTQNMTIMFTDVVGSTELLDRLGDELAGSLLRRHFGMLRAAAIRHGGREVKSLGDGLMLVFDDPRAAATCAAAMQRDVLRHRTGEVEGRGLRMRIGVHRGSVQRDANDYFGKNVVIAKRLCDICTAGQVLVSDAVRAVLCAETTPYADCGMLALRGITEPVCIAELQWQEATAESDSDRRVAVPA